MSTPAHEADTVELDTVYTAKQIKRELEHWRKNLANAKADGDILGVTTALSFLDTWLDRSLALRAAA